MSFSSTGLSEVAVHLPNRGEVDREAIGVANMRRGPNRPAQLYRLKKAKAPVCFARTFNPPG
jgi:hypothetical protein